MIKLGQQIATTAESMAAAYTYSFSPTELDVLCGKSRLIFEHKGNEQLRFMVASYLPAYIDASRRQKTDIVRQIVQEVKDKGGRFLKRSSSQGQVWYDIGTMAAREKVGHTFRDASKKRIKCIAEIRQSIDNFKDDSRPRVPHVPTTICTTSVTPITTLSVGPLVSSAVQYVQPSRGYSEPQHSPYALQFADPPPNVAIACTANGGCPTTEALSLGKPPELGVLEEGIWSRLRRHVSTRFAGAETRLVRP